MNIDWMSLLLGMGLGYLVLPLLLSLIGRRKSAPAAA